MSTDFTMHAHTSALPRWVKYSRIFPFRKFIYWQKAYERIAVLRNEKYKFNPNMNVNPSIFMRFSKKNGMTVMLATVKCATGFTCVRVYLTNIRITPMGFILKHVNKHYKATSRGAGKFQQTSHKTFETKILKLLAAQGFSHVGGFLVAFWDKC